MQEYDEEYNQEPDIDYYYDQAKDDAIMCDSNEEALRVHPAMRRFLPIEYKYYLHTVECRRTNKIPMGITLWRHENDFNL